MLVPSQVKVRRVPAGAIFVNEEGEESRHIGFMVMRQIGAILEAAAGEVVISFEVEVLPELAEAYAD